VENRVSTPLKLVQVLPYALNFLHSSLLDLHQLKCQFQEPFGVPHQWTPILNFLLYLAFRTFRAICIQRSEGPIGPPAVRERVKTALGRSNDIFTLLNGSKKATSFSSELVMTPASGIAGRMGGERESVSWDSSLRTL
jgi:hypothetical protein